MLKTFGLKSRTEIRNVLLEAYIGIQNSSVKQFTSELDCVLSNVTRRKIPFVVAGDVNIACLRLSLTLTLRIMLTWS